MLHQQLSTKVWQDPGYFIAFGFGSGLMPIAPGTWGTLAGIPLFLLIAGMPWSVYLAVTVAVFLLGVVICNRISSELGLHDYSGIVWDEVLGFLLTMFMAPVSVVWIGIGFLLFRLFDIWKPQPIRYIDRHVKGGLGIMLDDVLAAIPAWVLMQILIRYFGA